MAGSDVKIFSHRLHTATSAFYALVVCAVLWRALFFSVSVCQINASGDESIMGLQAIGITQSSDNPLFQTKQHPPGLFGRFPLLFMAQPYLFPLESYFSAPFIRLLPNNAFGLRLIPACMGLLTCIICLLLLQRWSRQAKSSFWLPALLVVFPSVYVLMLQSVYMLPSYPAFMLLTILAFWLADKNRSTPELNPFYPLLAGLCVGFVSSNTLLAMPVLAALAVMVILGPSWRKALLGAPCFAAGAATGLLPFYVAKQLYPGAHVAVSSLIPLKDAMTRLWSPAINFTLPTALGLRTTLMPDAVETLGILPAGILPATAVLWLLFMLAVSILCLVRFVQRLIKNKWPDIHIADLLTGLTWLYLLLFTMSTRFGSHEFRYLLPVALFFPLLFGHLFFNSTPLWKKILTGFGILLVVINIATATALLHTWTDASFDGYFTDTHPAIDVLQEKGITHCYSSYFDAYTINYLSNEKIICAQPFNERFFGWPYPYVDLVDRATNIAYVLGPSRRFKRDDFENDLKTRNIRYQVREAGKCRIYTDFHLPQEPKGHPIAFEKITVQTSHYPQDAHTLSDGILTHQWRSHIAQEKKMSITLMLQTPVPLERIRFYYNDYPHDHADAINIYIYENNQLVLTKEMIPFELAGFDFVNDHPVYGFQIQDIDLNQVIANKLTIELAEINAGRDWTIGEIELYEHIKEP